MIIEIFRHSELEALQKGWVEPEKKEENVSNHQVPYSVLSTSLFLSVVDHME